LAQKYNVHYRQQKINTINLSADRQERAFIQTSLANNQPSGSSGSVIFDGRDDSGEALRIGIYIIFLEAINEGSGVVENMKTVIVVARKL